MAPEELFARKVKTPGSTRFLPMIGALIFSGFACLSLLSYLRARELMDRQITANTLPLTSDVIISSLEQELLKPVLASGLMARNTFIEQTILTGEHNPDLLKNYLVKIQEKTNAATTFLVSERSHRYYHASGIIKQVKQDDPQDRWYFRFRDSGKPIEINVDRDTADLKRITAFINVAMREGQGQGQGRFLGATGLGLDFQTLQQKLRRHQQRHKARILIVDQDGKIVLASDDSKGSLQSIQGLAKASSSILTQASTTLKLSEQGTDLYVRSNRIPEIGWTVIVIQKRTAEEAALIDVLAQNLMSSALISLILLTLAQLTLGRDQQRLAVMARTDKLSGLLNRGMFDPLFQELVQHTRRQGEPVAVALMDIDDFKRINDTRGHATGDGVIRHVSQRIVAGIKKKDLLFRWGGEEFLLLLPGCDLKTAHARLEAVREDLSHHPFLPSELNGKEAISSSEDSGVPVTLSFGLTCHHPGESASELLQRADQALYAAKREGRDRICIREPVPA